jgi:hypothetical protein
MKKHENLLGYLSQYSNCLWTVGGTEPAGKKTFHILAHINHT